MKTGYRVIALMLVFVSVFFAGCGKKEKVEQVEDVKETDILEIGICFDSFVIERWIKDRDVFVSTAQDAGAQVNVQNANGDVEKQKEQINYFIDKGVDCLVIVPIDGYALSDEIKKAKNAGIKVIAYDRLICNADVDLYISFDNEAVGVMLGDSIKDSQAKSVVMICGPLTDGNVTMVIDGFEGVMKKNSIDVIDKFYVDGWKAELASSYVYENMDTIKEADAIMCGNDDIATAVIRALAVSRLAGVKTVVGQDADVPACQHIIDGTQRMTVYKPVSNLATQAAEIAVQFAKGDEVKVNTKMDDGTYKVPYIAIQPVMVDSTNLDEVIIDGGYHTYDDIYINKKSSEE